MNVSRVDKFINDILRHPTLKESSDLRADPVALVLSDIEPTKRATMAHVAVTLALRCYSGPIRIYGEAGGATGLPTAPTLGTYLGTLAHIYGAPERLEWRDGTPCESTALFIGRGPPTAFIADAAGWVAGTNIELPAAAEAEVPACMFAVSCVFAQLFGSSLLGTPGRHAWSFSLLDYCLSPSAPTAHQRQCFDCGEISILGAGALGSAFAYGLWLSTWTAHALVIDSDRYDEPNRETTCLIGLEHIRRCSPKATALAEAMRRPGLEAAGLAERVGAGSAVLKDPRRYFICGVDNPATRRELDLHQSTWLLNAGVGGTSRDAGMVLVSRHGPADPPLSGLYRTSSPEGQGGSTLDHLPSEAQDACSRIPYQQVSLAAPFVATAAASLLLASAAGHTAKMPSYLKLDLLGLQDKIDLRRISR